MRRQNRVLQSEISQHKAQLEALKAQDPEFYAYLAATDKELLEFGQGSEDEEEEEEEGKSNEDEQVRSGRHVACSHFEGATLTRQKAMIGITASHFGLRLLHTCRVSHNSLGGFKGSLGESHPTAVGFHRKWAALVLCADTEHDLLQGDSDDEVAAARKGSHAEASRRPSVTLSTLEGWCAAALETASVGAVRNIIRVRSLLPQ